MKDEKTEANKHKLDTQNLKLLPKESFYESYHVLMQAA
jgi:hypothetical protein